jgi:NAD(P)-dependent dehydrogenase (short-subunit alcohol dehydrogenase family)
VAEFDGKVVIITGAANGMGRATALAFAHAGARVAIADLDDVAGHSTLEALRAAGGHGLFVKADVAQGEACRRVVQETVDTFGGVDVLFNNVGIQPQASYGNVEATTEAIWDAIMGVNLRSYFLMAKYAIPELRRRGGGVIVNNASVQGLQSMKGVPAYAASKGGVLSLTASWPSARERSTPRWCGPRRGTSRTASRRPSPATGAATPSGASAPARISPTSSSSWPARRHRS